VLLLVLIMMRAVMLMLLLRSQEVLAALPGDMPRERQSVWCDVVAAAATGRWPGTEEDVRAEPAGTGVCAESSATCDTDRCCGVG